MRILITGGAGFIGSNFVRRTLTGAYPGLRGAHVTVLDLLTYAGNRDNLAPVARHPAMTFRQGDIADEKLVRDLMRDVELVVHFAAETHVDRSIEGGHRFVATNVLGTHTLLDAARQAGVPKIVQISTDEVYGSISAGSWTEDEPLLPNSPYSASKAAADLLARAQHSTHGLPVCIVRPSNGYGPYQFPEKLIPLFVTSLLDGLTVPLYGDGGHIREWLHVDDLCRAVALVAERGLPGEVYNVGGESELTNLELTETLLRLTGRERSLVRRVPDRLGHDRRYSMATEKIARLGFRPRIALATGLAATVRWYAAHRAWWEPLRG
ncbi:dTDP-glucose 4,6-dehydratase [Actinomadura sp. KC06]|uniref:dTDP-glucose 4,6-dehydratase n=1 Tax=Actinomadura sp. KC06 TaxID=2530369 RepID=UPI00104C74E2|nr:dTDP-glucose 4,6-dehydratase [Actinomadura sp. KC06]TDD37559.1 dTDP-glucose 4,6-dehydratase [Actinomadura sp. KC06]